MLDISALFKRKTLSVLKNIGISLSLIWSGYNVWTTDALYKRAVAEKDELRQTLSDVVVRVASFNYDINDVPFPMWAKVYVPQDDSFRMVKINTAYIEKYKVSNIHYFGKRDENVTAAGYIYTSNDRIAMDAGVGKVIYVYEPYFEDNQQKFGHYAKWRIERSGEIFIYGMEMP